MMAVLLQLLEQGPAASAVAPDVGVVVVVAIVIEVFEMLVWL